MEKVYQATVSTYDAGMDDGYYQSGITTHTIGIGSSYEKAEGAIRNYINTLLKNGGIKCGNEVKLEYDADGLPQISKDTNPTAVNLYSALKYSFEIETHDLDYFRIPGGGN